MQRRVERKRLSISNTLLFLIRPYKNRLNILSFRILQILRLKILACEYSKIITYEICRFKVFGECYFCCFVASFAI